MLKLNIRPRPTETIVEVIDTDLWNVYRPNGEVIFTQAATGTKALRRVLANVRAVYKLDLTNPDAVWGVNDVYATNAPLGQRTGW